MSSEHQNLPVSPGGVRIDRVVTSGTFELDGGSWEVDNNVWIVGDDADAIQLSSQLLEKGFWISAIRPPTVPEGSARLRITLSAAHTRDQIDALAEALQ